MKTRQNLKVSTRGITKTAAKIAKAAADKAVARAVSKGKTDAPSVSKPSRRGASAADKPARARPPKLVFNAPPTFSKSAAVEVVFSTDRDGFVAPGTIVEFLAPRSDERYDMVRHDPDTALCLASRICMLTYITNPAKRLPANTEYTLLLRVSVAAARDNEVKASVKTVWSRTLGKKKSADLVEMDKKDPVCSRLRRSGKFLAPAFTKALNAQELQQLVDAGYEDDEGE